MSGIDETSEFVAEKRSKYRLASIPRFYSTSAVDWLVHKLQLERGLRCLLNDAYAASRSFYWRTHSLVDWAC